MARQSGAVIERQIRLPLSQAFKISLRNITLRLGRAAVTAASIFLAIAFLSSVLATKVIQDTIDKEVKERGRVTTVGEDVSIAGDESMGPTRLPGETGELPGAGSGGESSLSGGPSAALAIEETDEEDARRWWLVAMSLLVCLAGITNAMLMSVTERFREIGTMKCLGALDSFVVRLFLIESTLLGVIGSALGAIAGAFLMLFVYCIREGFSLPARISWPDMLGYMGASIGVGAVIALLAAIAPAVAAARLPPAAALRTEI